LGILVVEAGSKSGALITSSYAAAQGREVFAVPGSIYSPVSEGCNSLIKSGAHPVTSLSDILFVLGITPSQSKTKPKLQFDSKEEEVLFSILTTEPTSIDKLHHLSKLDIATLNAVLATLEVKGLIKDIGAGRYIKIVNKE